MKKAVTVAALVLAIATVLIINRRRSEPVPRSWPAGAVPSPKGDRAVLAEQGDGKIKVVLLDKRGQRTLASFPNAEGVHKISWSPGGSCLAFESYSLNGHSPMTTTHAWVVRDDGAEVKQIELPGENQHLSTFVDEWEGASILRIRSTVLNSPDDALFRYGCDSGRLEGPVR